MTTGNERIGLNAPSRGRGTVPLVRNVARLALCSLTALAAMGQGRAAEPLHLENFGAVCNGKNDDTAAFQRAITTAAGRAMRLPAGTCVITQTISYVTSSDTGGPILLGQGRYQSRIDARIVDGPAFHLDSSTPNRTQRGGRFQDFSIMSTKPARGGSGLRLRGVWQFVLENVAIEGLDGDGIRIVVRDGDPDGSLEIQVRSSWIANNGGLGLDVETHGIAVEHSFLTVTNTYFVSNRGGGARFRGLIAAFRDSAFVLNRGIGGLLVAYAGSNNISVDITGCDFENNEPRHLDLESVIGAQVRLSQFLSSAVYDPIEMVKIGGAGTALNVEFYGAFMRNLRPTAAKAVGFRIDPSALYTRVRATRWDNFVGPRFADKGLLTRMEEEGYELPTPTRTVSVTLHGSMPTYAPDVTRATIHQVEFRGSGAYRIGTPIHAGAATGLEMVLDLVNRSDTAVVVEFDSIFVLGALTPLLPGTHRVARFYFSSAEGWIQITPWAESRAR